MRTLAAIILRLIVGALTGFIIGIPITVFAVGYYPERDPSQMLVEHEDAERQFRFTVLFVITGLVAVISAFAGRIQLGSQTKAIFSGALVGVACAVFAVLVAASERNEFPFRGKSPQTAITWGRNVGLPVCSFLGGLAGNFVFRLRQRRITRNEQVGQNQPANVSRSVE